MKLPRERELKYVLGGAADYRRLAGAEDLGPFEGPVLLVNHYFDTEDRHLAARRAMLRLRESPRGPILTFKHGGEVPGRAGHFDVVEIESPVPPELFSRALEEPAVLFATGLAPVAELERRFGRPLLRPMGRLEVERRKYSALPFPLELDRIVFPDGFELYEAEVETPDLDAAAEWLEEEFRRRGVRAEPQRKTKFELLLERLGSASGS